MDQNLVYVKTPIGDEAVRQSTRVVQRNLRMVLVQVDGKLTVAELSSKIGNQKLVVSALRELEEGGFIAPSQAAASVWDESKRQVQQFKVSAISQFSSFGPKPVSAPESVAIDTRASTFSTFGKPILPVSAPPPAREVSSPKKEKPEHDPDQPRLPLKLIVAGLAGLLVLLLVVVLLFPYDRFRPEVEAVLGDALQTPVRVGRIDLHLLPHPQLQISDIRLGNSADSAIERIRLNSPFALLLSGRSALTQAELSGVTVTADQLTAIATAPGGSALRRVVIERMTVSANELSVRELSGEILFLDSGKMEKASLQSVDRTLRLEAQPSALGLLLKIEAYGWRPASETAVAFESMQAKGLLQRGKLVIQDLDTTVLGGVAKGSWFIDWSNGLVMAGDANLTGLDINRIATVFAPSMKLEGELAGNLRLRSSGENWEALWANSEATLDATVNHGIFHGVDLGEATRRGAGYIVRSGSTKFETLRAELTLKPGTLSARNIQLNAGMMSATGQFASKRDRQIDGNFVVVMQSSVSTLRAPVKVSGTLPDLVATGGR